MLDDLSFLRFPELTPRVGVNIAVLLSLLCLTVLLTVLVQRFLHARTSRQLKRASLEHFVSEHHMSPQLRDLLRRVTGYAGLADVFALVHDAPAYEQAVDSILRLASAEEAGQLARLRRILRMNVLNPDLTLLHTRQLLADSPVRVEVSLGQDKLDVYCSLISVNEEFLILDISQHKILHEELKQNPEVLMSFWGEQEGEKIFKIRLEPVSAGSMGLYRAGHAYRDEGILQREALRLSVNIPASYTYLTRGQLALKQKEQVSTDHTLSGEGVILGLSHGGASFKAAQHLAPEGFAQVEFAFHTESFKAILEVLSSAPMEEEGVLVRGRFRGLPGPLQTRLDNLITREQITRLQEKGIFETRISS